MKKALIASTARMGFYEGQNRIFDNQTYLDAISLAGGFPIIVGYGTKEDYQRIAMLCDGLLITGGEDLDPSLFNQIKHPTTICSDPRIDELDFGLIEAFHQLNKPILGICRGLQSLNVYFGGTLYQDINSFYPHHLPQGHLQNKQTPPIPGNQTSHSVTFLENTTLYSIFGQKHTVNSFHHQNIDYCPSCFSISAMSEDGLIEGIEMGDQILAVQWHPERLVWDEKHLQLFTHFIKQCQK